MSPGAEGSTLVTGAFPVFETPVSEVTSAPAERTGVSRAQQILVSERLNRAVNFSVGMISV